MDVPKEYDITDVVAEVERGFLSILDSLKEAGDAIPEETAAILKRHADEGRQDLGMALKCYNRSIVHMEAIQAIVGEWRPEGLP